MRLVNALSKDNYLLSRYFNMDFGHSILFLKGSRLAMRAYVPAGLFLWFRTPVRWTGWEHPQKCHAFQRFRHLRNRQHSRRL